MMRSAQNGSSSSSERSRGRQDTPKRNSYHGDTNRTSPISPRGRLASSPQQSQGNGLVVPLERQGSVSSEQESYATPPSSLSNSRETSPTGVHHGRNHSTSPKPSQRVHPMPSRQYGRSPREESQTASDSQDVALGSSGSSSPKMWHVNPLQQQTRAQNSHAPKTKGKTKARLGNVPQHVQRTGHSANKQGQPFFKQTSLPRDFDRQHSHKSPPVTYTPPPQLRHQHQTPTSPSQMAQSQQGMLRRHYSCDHAVGLARSPSPQRSALTRHNSEGNHSSAFTPPSPRPNLPKQLSLQDEYVHYENGERFRYPESKNRNQAPPPPPQRSSSHRVLEIAN
ncbi:uncharacterized protein LOC144450546 [Glandiceps talaboti]